MSNHNHILLLESLGWTVVDWMFQDNDTHDVVYQKNGTTLEVLTNGTYKLSNEFDVLSQGNTLTTEAIESADKLAK